MDGFKKMSKYDQSETKPETGQNLYGNLWKRRQTKQLQTLFISLRKCESRDQKPIFDQ